MTAAGTIARPPIVSQTEWDAALAAVTEREKAVAATMHELAVARKRMPMVRVERDYRFEAPDGLRSLPRSVRRRGFARGLAAGAAVVLVPPSRRVRRTGAVGQPRRPRGRSSLAPVDRAHSVRPLRSAPSPAAPKRQVQVDADCTVFQE